MVKAVHAKGARPDVKYEVADGSYIEHVGEKNVRVRHHGLLRFTNELAHQIARDGARGDLKSIRGAGRRARLSWIFFFLFSQTFRACFIFVHRFHVSFVIRFLRVLLA